MSHRRRTPDQAPPLEIPPHETSPQEAPPQEAPLHEAAQQGAPPLESLPQAVSPQEASLQEAPPHGAPPQAGVSDPAGALAAVPQPPADATPGAGPATGPEGPAPGAEHQPPGPTPDAEHPSPGPAPGGERQPSAPAPGAEHQPPGPTPDAGHQPSTPAADDRTADGQGEHETDSRGEQGADGWGEHEVLRIAATRDEFPEPLVLVGSPRLGSDPRGLPASEPAVPDTVLDGADLDGLTIRAASVRGDDHRYLGEIRQDSMGIWQLRHNDSTAILACVADGVGSEPFSHRGSSEACRCLRDEAERRLPALLAAARDSAAARDGAAGQDGDLHALCQEMVEDVGMRLADLARRLAIAPKSLSTTLVGALFTADPANPERCRCLLFNVGDSGAFLLRDGSFASCFPDPHDGPIANTGVNALPTTIGQVATTALAIGPADMLLVCTDGLSNPMRNDAVRRQLAQWWGRDRVPGLPQFGWQLSFRAKSFGDDRTAICVWGR